MSSLKSYIDQGCMDLDNAFAEDPNQDFDAWISYYINNTPSSEGLASSFNTDMADPSSACPLVGVSIDPYNQDNSIIHFPFSATDITDFLSQCVTNGRALMSSRLYLELSGLQDPISPAPGLGLL